jgi:hypothetical protein
MACIKLIDKRITDGKNTWIVSGQVLPNDTVALTQVHGDITDVAGIGAAMRALIASRKRYRRVLSRVS